MALVTKVVEPIVVSETKVPSVSVEIIGEVTVDSTAPPVPVMVVSPVTVVVVKSVVKVEVHVLVVIALALSLSLDSPGPAPFDTVVTMVEPSLVIVMTTPSPEVVGETVEVSVPPEPEPLVGS